MFSSSNGNSGAREAFVANMLDCSPPSIDTWRDKRIRASRTSRSPALADAEYVKRPMMDLEE
jgi:hypothetical protein